MRRLAKQDRDDRVKSNRDYQEIKAADALHFSTISKNRIRFSGELLVSGTHYFGTYLSCSKHCDITIKITCGSFEITKNIHLSSNWNRAGFEIGHLSKGQVFVEIEFQDKVTMIKVWGLTIGVLNQINAGGLSGLTSTNILDPHLSPESFFLSHSKTTFLPDKNSPYEIKNGIALKKCAYCQRLLPLDPKNVLQLGFHKHSAKKSGHQNECRACKKFRINDFFNPKRTSDQLHESSVITREKKVLLREPNILQEFKNRHNGEGLRTFVWERFNKKCFKCSLAVKLNEFELDHTRPLSYLWPLDEYATCLCEKCNNFKKDRFPTDFYSQKEIERLATVVGLSVAELNKKDINRKELARIKKNLILFAEECDPRTFRSIAVRVKEYQPDEDLFERLKELDPKLHKSLLKKLATRPD
jgi:hypothetical protein